MAKEERPQQPRLRTMAGQIADTLGHDILFRRLKPGQRLREIELTDRFGVSRPVIREVLAHLEKFGLVETEAWKGARVMRLSRKDIEVLFEIRGMVFAFIVRRVAEAAGRLDLSAVEAVVADLGRAARSADAEGYELLRIEAHRRLALATGDAHHIIRRVIRAERMSCAHAVETVRTREQRLASAARWRRLLALIQAGDPEVAAGFALEMNQATADGTLRAFDRLPDTER